MQDAFGHDPRLRFLLGDVRDGERLVRATRGVDVIVHAAALKQVPACEYNPTEAVRTNIIGAENVVSAAIANDVPADHRAVHRQGRQPRQPVRGDQARRREAHHPGEHVLGRLGGALRQRPLRQRGRQPRLVLPLFVRQAQTGTLTITDERMTRFWITLHAGRRLRPGVAGGHGGRRGLRARRSRPCASPTSPTRSRRTPAADHRHPPGREAARGHAHRGRVAPRPGARRPLRILPEFPTWRTAPSAGGTPCTPGFRYASDTNDRWLTQEELRAMLADGDRRRW